MSIFCLILIMKDNEGKQGKRGKRKDNEGKKRLSEEGK